MVRRRPRHLEVVRGGEAHHPGEPVSRLSELSEDSLAAVVRAAARKQCERLCAALDTTAAALPVQTPIERTLRALVRFAKTGVRDGDLEVRGAVNYLRDGLYTSASGPYAGPLRAWLASDEDTLAFVARVCLARVALESGEDIPRHWLSDLAQCSEKVVRGAIANGELSCVEGERGGGGKAERPVTAESARAWLVARGSGVAE